MNESEKESALDFPSAFHFLAALHGLWDLSFLTRDRTSALAVKALNSSHWAARKFPI